jgi:hypothetical protein
MLYGKKILYLFMVASLITMIPASTHSEEIRLTTYYPAPFGDYDTLTANDLDVSGSVTLTGPVGIGTTTPGALLDVSQPAATAGVGGAAAIGTANTATGDSAIALGAGNTASGDGSIAIGVGTTASGTPSIALGGAVDATGVGGIAIGLNTIASGQDATVLGQGFDTSNKLDNSTASSFMVGYMNSISDTTAELFIQDGQIGINTLVPTPGTVLDVQGTALIQAVDVSGAFKLPIRDNVTAQEVVAGEMWLDPTP